MGPVHPSHAHGCRDAERCREGSPSRRLLRKPDSVSMRMTQEHRRNQSTGEVRYLRPRESSQAGVLTGRFRRASRLVDDEAGTRAVAQAVVRAKQGDREALRFLYVHYADHVYGYVASIVRDEHEAEDVTQHLFAKLMTALPKYEPREVPFSAWILRVARNVAVDHMRQRRAIPCEEVRELDTHHEDDDAARMRAYGLRDALATLPEDQRQVVVMRHVV